MTFNYQAMQGRAAKLIAKFGQSISLAQDTLPSYDSVTGSVTKTSKTYSGIGVILPYGDGVNVDTGGLVQRGDALIYTSISQEPKPKDKITIKNVVWSIIHVKSIEPAGVNVIYEIQVRK
jgi:hypothetical protein